MTDPIVVFVACVAAALVLAGLAPIVLARAGRIGWVGEAGVRGRGAIDAMSPWLTRFGAALVTGVVAVVAVLAVCWPLGWLSRAAEAAVDVPVFDWASSHAEDRWVRVNEVLTDLGANWAVQLVVIVAVVPLALLWRRRGWWIPVTMMLGMYAAQRVGQITLERVIRRNTPPAGGDYPSGGVSRVLVVYGTIVLLVCVGLGLSRFWRRLLLTLVFLAAVAEAYTRVYLLKHWLTDVVAGLVYGGLLLVVSAAVLWVLSDLGTNAEPLGIGERLDDDGRIADHDDAVGDAPTHDGARPHDGVVADR